MSELDAALAANRQAATSFLITASSVAPARWAVPIAPGKWSPAQITEHIAVAYEVELRALKGDSKMGSAPRFLRPIARAIAFTNILKKGAFPAKMKGPPAFAPSATHPDYGLSAARLEAAVAAIESQAREMAAAGRRTFEHPIFGQLDVADYVRYGELHARHHEGQLTVPAQA